MIVGDLKGVARESQGRVSAVAGEFAVQFLSKAVPNTVLVSLFQCLQQLLDALGAEEHLKFTDFAHRNQVELEWSNGVVVLKMLKLQFAWMLSGDQQDEKRSRMGRRRLEVCMEPAARRRPAVEEVGGSQELLWFENYENLLDTHGFGDYNDVDNQVSLKELYAARANKVSSLKEEGATSAIEKSSPKKKDANSVRKESSLKSEGAASATNSMAGAEGLRRGEGASAADAREHAWKVLPKRGGGRRRRRGPSANNCFWGVWCDTLLCNTF